MSGVPGEAVLRAVPARPGSRAVEESAPSTAPEPARGAPPVVERVASAALPIGAGPYRAVAYRVNDGTGVEHLALVLGDVAAAAGTPRGALVRIHSECLTGDVLGSQRCDCGPQLDHALDAIATEGRGVVVYLRGHEGRGIGLAEKIRAYALQERGLDTVDANLALGLPVDDRSYAAGAAILADLGVRRLRLMTNNPDKLTALADHGLEVVERIAVPAATTPHNVAYLRTKRTRMGHGIDGLDGD